MMRVLLNCEYEKIYKILNNTCIFKNSMIIYIATVQYPSQDDRLPSRA